MIWGFYVSHRAEVRMHSSHDVLGEGGSRTLKEPLRLFVGRTKLNSIISGSSKFSKPDIRVCLAD